MTPRVSVIVPVYNAMPHLQECLASILGQSLRNLEVICVDDGSTDDSLSFLQEQARQDRRVTVLEQPHSSAGAARNRGLALARGKYLSFLDADDLFAGTMLETAYDRAEAMSVEVVCFGADRYVQVEDRFESTPWTLKLEQFPRADVFSSEDIRPNVFRATLGWTWDKLFLRDYIRREGLEFQDIRIHNDMFFVYSAVLSAQRIAIIDKVLVHQRVRPFGSLSTSAVKATALDCVADALESTRNRLVAKGQDQVFGRDFRNYALSLFLYHLDSLEGPAREELYRRIQGDWIRRFGLDTVDEFYFYRPDEYERLQDMRFLPYERYLRCERLQAESARQAAVARANRVNASRLKTQLSRANTELARAKKDAQTSRADASAVRSSRAYLLGRLLLGPARLVRRAASARRRR